MPLREIQTAMDEISQKWKLGFLIPENGGDDVTKLSKSLKAMLMAKSIIDMAGMLGIGVVAEGVDSVDQLDWLAKNEEMKAQGYFFSAPAPPEEAEHILADANAFYTVAQR